MTVTFRGEIPTERTGTNNQGVRTYTRKFLLESDTPSETIHTVGSNASLPRVGSAYPGDPTAQCLSLNVRCTNGYKGWTATAQYSTDTGGTGPQAAGGAPEDDSPKITWSSENFVKPVFQDNAGNALVNPVGDPYFDPAPTKETAIIIASISQNVLSVPSYVLAYPNSINNAAITIDGLAIGAKLAKVQRILVGPEKRRSLTIYRTVTIEIHLNRDGWNLQPMQVGFNRKYGGNVKPIRMLDLDSSGNSRDTTPITTPVPIDDNGEVIQDPTAETILYDDFDIYEELDFTNLPGVT